MSVYRHTPAPMSTQPPASTSALPPAFPLPLADPAQSAPETALTRHTDLWLPDGSVVLQAERTLFRVHMSQLSRHSVIFRDMFALPQPRPPSPSVPAPAPVHATFAEAMCEGCPLVLLHDAAADVGHLLTALYDGPKFGCNDCADFRMAAGILRLASKYMMDSLRAKALAHLALAWPGTLKAWEAREDRARAHELEHGAENGHLYPNPIAVINLAREVHAPTLLPSAFYDLSRYTYAQIFEAEDDTSRFRAEPPAPMPLPALSACDTQKLALGKEAAAQAVSAVIHGMARGPHSHTRKAAFSLLTPAGAHAHGHAPSASLGAAAGACASPGACRRDFAELVALATQHYICDRERGCADPLYVAEELGALKSAELSECGACARGLEIWAARERERMWKMIPLWFRLES